MTLIESINFKRNTADELLAKLIRGQSILLLGPRQTGKSTLLARVFAQLPTEQQLHYYFQLPSERERIEADPESMVREVEARWSGVPLYLYIDEIQKIPKVMDVLQFLIDHKKVVVAASGSSARKLRVLGANWLPGRVHLHYLYPLTWPEIQSGNGLISLSDVLRFGSLPAILAEPEERYREEALRAYTHLYLDEEIRMEALTRNLPRFTKFLRLTALESGTAPNYSKIAETIGTSHTTVKEYFHVLEDTLIIHPLKAFGTSRDQVLRTSKYYFFDNGVRNAAAQIGHSAGMLTLQQGVLFEHWVVLQVMAIVGERAELSYYRHKQGHEVDLIVEKGQRRIAIEIKSTRKPNSDDFKGLTYFNSRYPCEATYVACQITKAQKFDTHLALPWQEVLERIAEFQ